MNPSDRAAKILKEVRSGVKEWLVDSYTKESMEKFKDSVIVPLRTLEAQGLLTLEKPREFTFSFGKYIDQVRLKGGYVGARERAR